MLVRHYFKNAQGASAVFVHELNCRTVDVVMVATVVGTIPDVVRGIAGVLRYYVIINCLDKNSEIVFYIKNFSYG